MQDHYDPSYAKSRGARAHPVLARIEAAGLSPPARDALAARIAETVRSEG
jgi:hypothetical protein